MREFYSDIFIVYRDIFAVYSDISCDIFVIYRDFFNVSSVIFIICCDFSVVCGDVFVVSFDFQEIFCPDVEKSVFQFVVFSEQEIPEEFFKKFRIFMEIRYEKLNHGNFGGRSLDEFIRNQTIFATMSRKRFLVGDFIQCRAWAEIK